jgi:uncharacterized cupredoxin-like copper-binding protein
MRGVGWLCLASVASLLASLVAVPAFGSAAAETGIRTVNITIHYSHYQPGTVIVAPGETVRFVVRNTDPIDHEFIVGDRFLQRIYERGTEAVHSMPGAISVPAGTTRSTIYSFPEVDSGVIFACHLPGHFAYGMRGVVIVRPEPTTAE